ncbi:hypothetical protein M501DRAFT_857200 [Patellaria atrata CBS 101060]|uniref:Uncharacterized protein n=1 Tax=Patellaria atrata CBS 101060 TaxID=1346257 RepID=A0A9P4VQC3_9PEZI|nr:hypothetical protein M501DRAFT_857200 [Patellaria atrata CBS 101060]
MPVRKFDQYASHTSTLRRLHPERWWKRQNTQQEVQEVEDNLEEEEDDLLSDDSDGTSDDDSDVEGVDSDDEDMDLSKGFIGSPDPSSTRTSSGIPTSTVSSGAAFANLPSGSTTARPTATALADSDIARQGHSHGLSPGTKHLLIAAGSIFGTLFLVLILFLVYRVWKQGIPIRQAFDIFKRRRSRSEYVSTVGTEAQNSSWPAPAYEWKQNQSHEALIERKDSFAPPAQSSLKNSLKGSLLRSPVGSMKQLPRTPRPVMINNESKPRSAPMVISVQAMNHDDPKTPMTEKSRGSFLEEASPPPVPQIKQQIQHNRDPSTTPSSPVLPLQSQRNTQSSLSSDHDDEEVDMPAPLMYGIRDSAPKISRFSWTNTQASQTPREPRFSVATSRSSVPRFRTVESWVENQTGRVERQQSKEEVKAGQAANQEPVPNVPVQYKHQTSYSEQTVFRQHPGTEVVMQRGSRVPSEILDKMRPADF